MGVLSWVLFGLAAGTAARFVVPGGRRIDFFWWIVVGVAGAGIGGYLSTEVLGVGSRDEFDLGSFLIAAGTSLTLLAFWERIDRALPGRERKKEGESWMRHLE